MLDQYRIRRRAAAGSPLTMHKITRRVLHDEIERSLRKPFGSAERAAENFAKSLAWQQGELDWWRKIMPRVLLFAGATAVLTIIFLLSQQRPPPKHTAAVGDDFLAGAQPAVAGAMATQVSLTVPAMPPPSAGSNPPAAGRLAPLAVVPMPASAVSAGTADQTSPASPARVAKDAAASPSPAPKAATQTPMRKLPAKVISRPMVAVTGANRSTTAETATFDAAGPVSGPAGISVGRDPAAGSAAPPGETRAAPMRLVTQAEERTPSNRAESGRAAMVVTEARTLVVPAGEPRRAGGFTNPASAPMRMVEAAEPTVTLARDGATVTSMTSVTRVSPPPSSPVIGTPLAPAMPVATPPPASVSAARLPVEFPAVQSFVQVDARAQLRPNLNSPAVLRVLTSFAFDVRQDKVVVRDADGSIYSGTTTNLESLGPAGARLRQAQSPRPAGGGANTFGFMVTGTNRTLGQRVEFRGVYLADGDFSTSLQNLSATSLSNRNVDGQKFTSSATARIQGQATLEGQDRVEVNAVLKP